MTVPLGIFRITAIAPLALALIPRAIGTGVAAVTATRLGFVLPGSPCFDSFPDLGICYEGNMRTR